MTDQDIQNYYTGLLILQYSSLPNAQGTVMALMKRLIQSQIVQKVQDGFSIDTAIGAQIDLLASYRGVTRVLFGAAPGSDWSLPEYADPNYATYLGFVEYADASPTWLTLQYDDLNNLPYDMTDYQLRTMVLLKAEIDSWDGTMASLDEIMFDFFGTYVNVVDGENMTMTYQHQAIDPDPNTIWKMTVLAGILPHPAGVSVTTVEV